LCSSLPPSFELSLIFHPHRSSLRKTLFVVYHNNSKLNLTKTPLTSSKLDSIIHALASALCLPQPPNRQLHQEQNLVDDVEPFSSLPPYDNQPISVEGVKEPSLYGRNWFFGVLATHRYHILPPGGYEDIRFIYQHEQLEVYSFDNPP
jgi:hypothetical protein